MKSKNNDFKWTKEMIQQHLDNKNYQKLNLKDEYGRTGFIRACVNRPELAKIMLKKNNIDFNAQDEHGDTGFIESCIQHPELAEMMLKRDDINFNIQNNLGHTGFIKACQFQPELVKVMLSNKKIDKELKNKNGLTGYDLAKELNSKSFNIYETWLTEKEKDNINTQVQKRTKKPRQHL